MGSAEKEWWKAAMQKEMESIYSNDVWDLVELPNNRRPVGCKWVFKRKTKANGSIELGWLLEDSHRNKDWTMTRPSVQSSGSNRCVVWLQLLFKKVSSFISWISLQHS